MQTVDKYSQQAQTGTGFPNKDLVAAVGKAVINGLTVANVDHKV